MVLEKINQVNDIKKLDKEELSLLAAEIRQFLIEKISVTGGHLASNLGVVELTMALHLAFYAAGRQDYLGCGAPVLHTQDPDRTARWL